MNTHQKDEEMFSQIRRCHRCDQTIEQLADRVEACESCGAHFAPFFYAELTPDVLLRSNEPGVKPASLVLSNARDYRAIVGLTWWWSETIDSGEGLMPRA